MRNGWEEVTGHESWRHLTYNGQWLLNQCAADELKAGGSLFCHKNIRKWIWLADRFTTSTSACSKLAGPWGVLAAVWPQEHSA